MGASSSHRHSAIQDGRLIRGAHPTVTREHCSALNHGSMSSYTAYSSSTVRCARGFTCHLSAMLESGDT